MVKNKPRNQTSVTNASKTTYNASYLQDVIETIQNRIIDITNEIAKVQPQYAQSLSNLQVEYFEATKNVIQNVSNLQNTFLDNSWNNFDNRSAIYTEQIKNQVNIFTENFMRACEIWNQITLNSIDISKENIKMYTQALTSMESYHRNLITSWNSLLIPTFGK
ncbi:MAG: hypothetical protein ACRD9Q_06110 [Nitrososphaeraceae archaeon]